MKRPPTPKIFSATVTFVLAILALLPAALTQPQHGDEAQYIWSAAYYGGKIAHLDFAPGQTSPIYDPGWAPPSYWNLTQPMGTRAILALGMRLAQAPTPPARAHYSPEISAPDELVAPRTLLAARLAAVICAALGFGLISLRLGWRGLAVAAAMLAMPSTRGDLARAWAEGPLLLGLGLAVLTYGSVWFAVAAGVAATFKLTALPLRPLVFLTTPIGRSRLRHILALAITAAVWTLLTPPAWFAGGPAFLVPMLADRSEEYAVAAVSIAGPFGLFLPSRYTWPFELGLLISLAIAAPRLWAHFSPRWPGNLTNQVLLKSRATK